MTTEKIKKDWEVTLSYDVRHNDTYLITDQTEEDAIYIAENQNQSSECICLKEVEDDMEVVDTTIKEVVFNSEKKKWLDKENQ
jgi:NADH:ubiquinone oxidoreductase subunit D